MLLTRNMIEPRAHHRKNQVSSFPGVVCRSKQERFQFLSKCVCRYYTAVSGLLAACSKYAKTVLHFAIYLGQMDSVCLLIGLHTYWSRRQC